MIPQLGVSVLLAVFLGVPALLEAQVIQSVRALDSIQANARVQLTPAGRRLDTLPSSAQARLPAPGQVGGGSGCYDCGSWRGYASPGYLIKDPENRTLLGVAPGDSTRRVEGVVTASDVQSIIVASGREATRLAGPGFEEGLVIITLTPEGVTRWRQHAKTRSQP